jgi:hypothetical protein
MPLKQNPHHQTPRETTNDHRSSSKAKDLPQADCQKRRPGCSRTPWHRGCPVKAAHRRRWHDTRKDDDTKTTAVRDGPHGYRPPLLHYHLSSSASGRAHGGHHKPDDLARYQSICPGAWATRQRAHALVGARVRALRPQQQHKRDNAQASSTRAGSVRSGLSNGGQSHVGHRPVLTHTHTHTPYQPVC